MAHKRKRGHMNEEPWALRPNETVCPDCHLAHNRGLPGCPVCAENSR